MKKHNFGIMKTDPKKNERYDTYEPEIYNCISVHYDYIEPLLESLSSVDCFWHILQCPGKNLVYSGISLIMPSSLKKFVEILGE